MFRAEKALLAAALLAAKGAVDRKSDIPILGNILIERGEGGLMARATDMDVEIACRFAAEISEDFVDFTCPAHGLVEFVKNAPATEVRLTPVQIDRQLVGVTIASGGSKLRIPVLPAIDFPALRGGDYTHAVTLDALKFRTGLAACRYCADTAPDRPYLHGVLVRGTKAGMVFVATDGKRLEHRLIPAIAFDQDADLAGLPDTIIGSAVVDQIVKLIGDEGDLTIDLSPFKIRLTLGDVTMTAKLIDGTYPDWTRAIPTRDMIRTQFSGRALNDALGRVLLATPDTGNGVMLRFADGEVVMRARDMSTGEAEDRIRADSDDERTFGMHGKHAREALDHMGTGDLEFMIGLRDSGEDAALLRRPGDPANFCLLSPMLVKGF